MLGRLLKYEFKSINRLAIPISAIALIAAIMGALALKVVVNAPENAAAIPTLICVLCVIASAVAIFAYTVVVWILLLHRFYTNMYTDEGYLTFTLPVKPKLLIISKLITAVVWSLISTVIVVLSVFVIITFGTSESLVNFQWLEGFKELSAVGFNASHLVFGAIYLLTSVVFSFLIIYLSITIAAVITRKHKILVAIGVYYGISTVVSIFTTLGEIVPNMLMNNAEEFGRVITVWNWFGIAIYIVFSVVAFVVCNELMKRKLNLD